MAERGYYDNDEEDEDEEEDEDPNPALTSLNITLIEHIIDADSDPFNITPVQLGNTEPIPKVSPDSNQP